MSIGFKIKRHRENLGLSQKQLAESAHIAQSSLHYIETNKKSPTYTTLQKLAGALNIPLSRLVSDRPKG